MNRTTFMREPKDKEHPYTMISNELLRDTKISNDAKLFMIQCLSNSDSYSINFEEEAKKLKWGHTKYQRVINELKEQGYIFAEYEGNHTWHNIICEKKRYSVENVKKLKAEKAKRSEQGKINYQNGKSADSDKISNTTATVALPQYHCNGSNNNYQIISNKSKVPNKTCRSNDSIESLNVFMLFDKAGLVQYPSILSKWNSLYKGNRQEEIQIISNLIRRNPEEIEDYLMEL